MIFYSYKCIGTFKVPENQEKWLKCPHCGLKPLIWEFDNGRSTACGCGKNKYDHFSIHAEDINSVLRRSKTGRDASEYNIYELQDNWNHWVKTGEIKYDPVKSRLKNEVCKLLDLEQ